jgi:UDP-N-acetylenolpyruvoylglucosamine reductase
MIKELEAELGTGRVQKDKNIAPYLTLRIRTTAEYYFEAETKNDIVKAYQVAKKYSLPFMILGGGSNIAVTKNVLNGLVVRNLYQHIEVLSEDKSEVELLVSSGYSIARLVNETVKKGWEGFEYHLGLPGTLGGGVAMNSKWYVERKPNYIGDHLIKAILVGKNGEVKEVDKAYFRFSYDYSILRDSKEIFVEGIFKLKKNDPEILMQRAKEASEFRRKTQVVGQPTCGCMFQNITEEEKAAYNLPTTSAGYLIDQVGLKNYQIGNFIVSDQHANFIINKGEGRPEDLLKLMELIKHKVHEKFGVNLKEEVLVI